MIPAVARCRGAVSGLFQPACDRPANSTGAPSRKTAAFLTIHSARKPQRRFVLIAAILASALGFIDGTVVSIAIPAIRSDIGATFADAQWISNAYAVTLSALILAGGAAGDNFGLRRTFVIGIVLFIVASLACALAPGPGSLIAARAVQGVGAAIMVPGSLAIIAKAYPKKERGRAIGIWAASSAMTTALGPVIGGLVLSAFDGGVWRLIFAINLPLGAIAVYLLLFKVPADKPAERRDLDLSGAAIATAGLGALAYGLTALSSDEAGSIALPLAFVVAGIFVFVGFIFWERRQDDPMVDLSLFRIGAFSGANAVTFFLYFALSGILFYLPMLLIAGWGLSEAVTGFIFVPLSLAMGLLSGPMGKLSDRIGPRLPDRGWQHRRRHLLRGTCPGGRQRAPRFLAGDISRHGADGDRHGAGRVAALDGGHDVGRGRRTPAPPRESTTPSHA